MALVGSEGSKDRNRGGRGVQSSVLQLKNAAGKSGGVEGAS
jgi:hypothetical protein